MALFYQFLSHKLQRLFVILTALITGTLAVDAQTLPGSGNALSFNGFSSYINCGTADRGVVGNVTVEAWIKTTSLNGQFAVTKYSNSFFSESGFEFGTSQGRALINGRAGKGVYFSSGSSTTNVSDGRWHHIAGQVDGSNWRIYVDGVLESSTDYGYTGGDLRTPEPMTIGTYTYLTNFYFNGEIDEVREWRTARTAAEIRDNMCRKFATAPADLVAYYRLDQTSGLTAVDNGSVPTTGNLISISATNWHLSGAPLGDASSNLYASVTVPASRVALGTAAGDSAIVSGVSAQARGVHVYAVNSAPSIAPPGAASPSYVGVFTVGPTGSINSYNLRLHPQLGPSCRSAYARISNDLNWTAAGQLPTTSTSLLLQNATYRGEYILSPGAVTTAAITGDSTICAGARTQLTLTSPVAFTVLWSNGATSPTLSNVGPGTYTATVSFTSGCSRVLRRTVRTLAAPSLTIGGDSLLCAGATTTLTALANGATTYLWSTGATTAAASITQPGIYTVTATYGTGCTVTARRTVRTLAAPGVVITGDSTVCAGTSTTLTAAATGATAYRWSTGATTATAAIAQAGTYTVTATYGTGCTVSARRTVRLSAIGAPAAFTLGADTTLCEGNQVLLQGPAGASYRYLWSDGSIGQQLLAQTAGRYTLRVTTTCGEQSASRTVALTSCVKVPNIVTANLDKHNDQFAVQGLKGEGWMLDVYNRWGRAVFQTANYHNEWGADAAPGVYYVLLRRPATGFVYKGWVEVVR